ncbi:hypothetical protein A5881_001882 [Enterococcus termitis]|nr:hypothetical protein A5881_001798 [Enterococcus termitis]
MVKPSICNDNKKRPKLPEFCAEGLWEVPVNSLNEIKKADRDHAYILPDDSVWVLSHDGKKFIRLNLGANGSNQPTLLENKDGLIAIDGSGTTNVSVDINLSEVKKSLGIDRLSEEVSGHIGNVDHHVTLDEKKKWEAKQEKLTAGENVKIANDVISVSDVVTTTEFVNEAIEIKNIVDLQNKIYGSYVENPNFLGSRQDQLELVPANGHWTERTQPNINKVTSLNNDSFSIFSDKEDEIVQVIFKWDLVSDIKRKYPDLLKKLGATTLDQEVSLVRKLVDGTIHPIVYVSGSGAGLNGSSRDQANMQIWSGITWQGGALNSSSSIKMLEYKKQTGDRVQNDGMVYINVYAPASKGTIRSIVNVDYACLEYSLKIKLSDIYALKSQVQTTKITRDDGQANITVLGTIPMLPEFLSKGTGFYTFVTGGATDAPELPLRGYVDMSRVGLGNVYASSDSGNFYHRFIENSKWKGAWKKLITAEDQFKPVEIVVPVKGNASLNNYIDAGYYLCRTNEYATNLLDTPINLAFHLEVQVSLSANNTPGVTQIFTTYHTGNPTFKRFARNLYNKVWSDWREIAFIDQVQTSKVTADNGESFLKITDTETMLARIISTGAGFKNGEASGKVSDSPTATNIRFLSNMVVPSAGSVIAQDTSGNVYSRIISGSVWRGEWQRLASTDQAQLSKVTADNGNHVKSFNSGTILDNLIMFGSGFRTFLAYGDVTDLPELGTGFRFFVNSGQGGFGSVFGATDKGEAYFRHFANNKWICEWRKLSFTDQSQNYSSTKITSQNWNDLKASGIYYVSGAVGANRPLGSQPYGYLEVLFNSQSVSFIQRYTDYSNNVYIRNKSGSPAMWQDWKKLPAETEEETIETKVTNLFTSLNLLCRLNKNMIKNIAFMYTSDLNLVDIIDVEKTKIISSSLGQDMLIVSEVATLRLDFVTETNSNGVKNFVANLAGSLSEQEYYLHLVINIEGKEFTILKRIEQAKQ